MWGGNWVRNKRKKNNENVRGGGEKISNGSSERAHFKECVVPVTVQDTVFWIEKKWQS